MRLSRLPPGNDETCKARLLPQFAEGCGLPLAEALALGPGACSDIRCFARLAVRSWSSPIRSTAPAGARISPICLCPVRRQAKTERLCGGIR